MKGPREFASAFLPGTTLVRLGRGGALLDVLYCGFGFTHTRRAVFDAVRARLDLEECNLAFRRPLVPYFAPLVAPDGRGDPWYLNEDYAFCERARWCGYGARADTRTPTGCRSRRAAGTTSRTSISRPTRRTYWHPPSACGRW
jgi:hypothetical protein